MFHDRASYCAHIKGEATSLQPNLMAKNFHQNHFCVCHLQAPQAFMTDNSTAERATLCTTWPESNFHVAQTEWRWLQASPNNVSRNERRELMTALQRVSSRMVLCVSPDCANDDLLSCVQCFTSTGLHQYVELIFKLRRKVSKKM